ncbi:hypothetical protein D3C83_288380 [compost metagenome]
MLASGQTASWCAGKPDFKFIKDWMPKDDEKRKEILAKTKGIDKGFVTQSVVVELK